MVDTGSLSISQSSGTTAVIGRGELDLRVESQFVELIHEALRSETNLVVDFRQSDFIDPQIIAALVAPAKKLLTREARIKVLVQPGGQPEHALATVGFAAILDIVSEVGDASINS